MALPVFNNTSGFETEQENNGRECKILGVYIDPSDNSEIDAIAMPQFKIQFTDNEEIHSAYPDEIEKEFWTQDMHDYFAGLQAYIDGKTKCPLKEAERKKAWTFGFNHYDRNN